MDARNHGRLLAPEPGVVAPPFRLVGRHRCDAELVGQLLLPLVDQGGLRQHEEAFHHSPCEQLLDDKPRLDGLAKADLVGQQRAPAQRAQHPQRRPLLILEPGDAAEGQAEQVVGLVRDPPPGGAFAQAESSKVVQGKRRLLQGQLRRADRHRHGRRGLPHAQRRRCRGARRFVRPRRPGGIGLRLIPQTALLPQPFGIQPAPLGLRGALLLPLCPAFLMACDFESHLLLALQGKPAGRRAPNPHDNGHLRQDIHDPTRHRILRPEGRLLLPPRLGRAGLGLFPQNGELGRIGRKTPQPRVERISDAGDVFPGRLGLRGLAHLKTPNQPPGLAEGNLAGGTNFPGVGIAPDEFRLPGKRVENDAERQGRTGRQAGQGPRQRDSERRTADTDGGRPVRRLTVRRLRQHPVHGLRKLPHLELDPAPRVHASRMRLDLLPLAGPEMGEIGRHHDPETGRSGQLWHASTDTIEQGSGGRRGRSASVVAHGPLWPRLPSQDMKRSPKPGGPEPAMGDFHAGAYGPHEPKQSLAHIERDGEANRLRGAE